MEPEDIIVGGQKYVPGSSPAGGSSKFITESFAALNKIVSGTDKHAANLVIGLANNANVEVELISSNLTTEASVSFRTIRKLSCWNVSICLLRYR